LVRGDLDLQVMGVLLVNNVVFPLRNTLIF